MNIDDADVSYVFLRSVALTKHWTSEKKAML